MDSTTYANLQRAISVTVFAEAGSISWSCPPLCSALIQQAQGYANAETDSGVSVGMQINGDLIGYSSVEGAPQALFLPGALTPLAQGDTVTFAYECDAGATLYLLLVVQVFGGPQVGTPTNVVPFV